MASIRQLFVRSSGREKHALGSTRLWKVCALLDRERELTAVDNLNEYDLALSIEHLLEQHLGIADEPVASEEPKPASAQGPTTPQ